MNYHKVKDNSDLVRDPNTGAILNTNSLDYDKYVAQRKVKNKEHEKTENIERDISTLRQELDEIKSLLRELVNG
jgi:hypothetical protein|tara:strand:+ start:25 stop:246 length:222 start_codon:yes stop_codon:yes gene_type:complete